jgi:hypothetical protein
VHTRECARNYAGSSGVKSLALGVLVACHPTTAPQRPAPSANLAPLAFYVGTWQCDGTQFDAAGKATEHMALEVRVAPEYESWLRIEVFAAGKQLTSELKGIDAKGTYHHVWTGNDGSFGSLTSAAGWQGAKLVFDEDHPDAESKTRMTFTKVDDAHYSHEATVDTGTGYHLDFQKVCHKVI